MTTVGRVTVVTKNLCDKVEMMQFWRYICAGKEIAE